jgi:hypothetical protein
MRCSDDARLDLWLDGALDAAEAAELAAHLATCADCAARRVARDAEERHWRAALAVDADDLAFLARADLAGAWRAAHAAARPALWWPALVVLALAGAYAAWLVVLPAVEMLVGLANRVGLVGLGAFWALGRLGQAAAALAAALAAPPLVSPAVWLAAGAVALWLYLARPWATRSTA